MNVDFFDSMQRSSHAGASQDLDFDSVIRQQGEECAALYLKLEECLVSSNRDWRPCQQQLKLWKECFEQRQRQQGGKK